MDKAFREQLTKQLRVKAVEQGWNDLIKQHSTPMLLLDREATITNINKWQQLLPDIDFYYAVKSQSSPELLKTIASANKFFDLASKGEIDLIKSVGIDVRNSIVTNPHLTQEDVDYAISCGVRTFVVDSEDQINRFIGKEDVNLIIRFIADKDCGVSDAVIDFSNKFGVREKEIIPLISYALKNDIIPIGLSFHIGSQNRNPNIMIQAIHNAIEIVDTVYREKGIRLTMIDIGGGFPVAYTEPLVNAPECFAAAILKGFGKRLQSFKIIAEPGRAFSAPSMTLITRIIGNSERSGTKWYFLDDGVYGSFSNVLTEHITPAILSSKEVMEGHDLVDNVVLAGPTCDSVDVIVTDYSMPVLDNGDLIISPMMGAYTSVTASSFNSFAPAKIVAV